MDNEPSMGVEPLVFRDRLSETDVVDFQQCLDRLLVRRSIRWLLGGSVTLLAALCLGSILIMGPHVVTVVVLIVWAYLLFGLPFERAWQARWHYRRHAAEYLETQVTLSLDHVTIVNEDLRSEFRWRYVRLVADAPAGIMFCDSARRSLFWLPARLFQGNGLREQVLTLAKCKGVYVQRLP